MKRLLLASMLLTSLARADIDFDGNDGKPSASEVEKNRACFAELSRHGCGDPGEDLQQFRVCLHDVFQQLTPDCRKMMSTLYKRRD